ncbi:MAG: inorganic pyrophosphatase [Patescibacteria group bacterium]|nr:inorganic pyrophosphatase [Patescibacteria group bacterium]
MDYSKLILGEEAPELVYAVVEIPQGSSNKYEFDVRFETIKLDRVLHHPFNYPGEYGFLPETIEADGDHLDILVLASQPTFPGCLLQARPVGLLEMEDSGKTDSKIIGISARDYSYQGINNYTDLPFYLPKQIEIFFQNYKKLEGKETKILGWKNAQVAKDYILNLHQKYLQVRP